MSDYQLQSRYKSLYSKFLSAPVILRVYLIFSTFSTVFIMLSIFVGPYVIKHFISSVLGGTAAFGYMFGLGFLFKLIFTDSIASQRIKMRFAVILLLGAYSTVEIYELLSYPANHLANPYFTMSIWRPLWSIVVPSVWLILLMSKRVTLFCKSPNSIPKNSFT